MLIPLWLAFVGSLIYPQDGFGMFRRMEVYAAIDAATDNPSLRRELRRICQRESACNFARRVGVQEIDAWAGRVRWTRAAHRGLLDPTRCVVHGLGEPERWSTRGAFGIAAAYAVRYIGNCIAPEALDDPWIAAVAAVSHARKLCAKYNACSCADRTRWWIGPGIWAAMDPLEREESIRRQCSGDPRRRSRLRDFRVKNSCTDTVARFVISAVVWRGGEVGARPVPVRGLPRGAVSRGRDS